MKHILATVILISSICFDTLAQQTTPDSSQWAAVTSAMGRTGQQQPDGVMKFGLPRGDLDVTVSGVKLKPALALGGWVAFDHPGPDAMVMGDLVLSEDEVEPVMARLQQEGINITALHNHVLHESPRVMYLHVGAHGDAALIARKIHDALALTKLPPSQPAAPAIGNIGIDTISIEQTIGFAGKVNGGVFQFGVPRTESITDGGMKVPNSMGLATTLNFQPTGEGTAAITGDFVLLGSEVNPVMSALRKNGIEVTAVHSHMLEEQPRLFFMHFWANNDAVKLAHGLREALDKTNSKRAK